MGAWLTIVAGAGSGRVSTAARGLDYHTVCDRSVRVVDLAAVAAPVAPAGVAGPAQVAVAIPGGHLWANEAGCCRYARQSDYRGAGCRCPLDFADPTGFSGSPAVDDQGNVYATSNGGTLYALTPAGDMRWQSALPADPVGVPALGIVPTAAGQPASALYVTDKAGGLSAFTLDGEFLWRTKTKTGRHASSGAVVGGDGTIYYTVVDRVEAVSPGGQPLWTSAGCRAGASRAPTGSRREVAVRARCCREPGGRQPR